MSTLRLPSIIGGALAAGLLSTVLLAGTASAQVTPPGTPEGFEHGYEMAGDVRYHFVRGGDAEGEPVILLHGWPTTWYLWHKMMPDLAEAGYDVIAVDTRGRGATTMTDGGYDVKTVAADIRALVDALGLETPNIVSHDLGGQVAFSYASEYPDAIDRLAIVEAPIPDANFGNLENPALDQNFWHFGFQDAEHVPEMLLQGRRLCRVLPRQLLLQPGQHLRRGGCGLRHLARAPRPPDHDPASSSTTSPTTRTASPTRRLRSTPPRTSAPAAWAGLEYYRAIEKNVADTETQIAGGPLEMPVLAVAGEIGIGFYLLGQIDGYATDVTKATLDGCGHWIPSECPDRLLELVLPHLAGE